MRLEIQKYINYLIATVSFLIWPCLLWADQVTQGDCRTLQPATEQFDESLEYGDALLWKISRDGHEPSYIFGTIHVSDPEIVELPEPVSSKLNASDVFVMEALPDPEESLELSHMMFFSDGRTLKDFIDDTLFDRTAEILSAYQFTPDAVMFMQPWAAFLIMNYPAEQGIPLDLQLLN
ncbi:MAG: TraB/GumN family protein, partial [Gammaproteobacteria bacterium]|nr:TraB/GumN family protein [Gammaproteobacteria bacterium]